MAVHNHQYIYVTGGEKDGHISATVIRFSKQNNKFSSMPDMQVVRESHAATIAGDTLYAVGGSNGRHSLATIEMLDLVTSNATW